MGAPTKPWLGLTGRPGSTGRAGGAVEVGLDGAGPRRPPGRTIPLQSQPDNSQKESPGEAGVGRWLWSRYSLFWLQRALREQRAPHLVHLEAWSPPKSGRHPQQIPKSRHHPPIFFCHSGPLSTLSHPHPCSGRLGSREFPGFYPRCRLPISTMGSTPAPHSPWLPKPFPKSRISALPTPRPPSASPRRSSPSPLTIP